MYATARLRIATLLLSSLPTAVSVGAVDVGIGAARLVVVDSTAARGKARVVFTSTDAGIAKGPAADPPGLEGTFEVFYLDRPSNVARFELAEGWVRNTETIARYANRDAPAAGGVRSLDLTPGRRTRLSAKSLGDGATIDLVSDDPGANGIGVTLTIRNAADDSTVRMCTRFAAADIELRVTGGGAGRKLVARNGQPVACGTSVAMEPAHAGGFFSFPWPNDVRLNPDGSLDLAGWPGRSANAVLDGVLAGGSAITFGFGTNAAAYFQSTGPLEVASLPGAENSLGDDAAVMLVDLDAPLAPRVPLLVDFRNAPTMFRPGNLLTLLPYPGHPLAAETRYAAIVFEGVRDQGGLPLRQASLLRELDDPWDASKPVGPTTWAALRQQRDDVLAYVGAHTDWSPEQVVAFTVFTTQDLSTELDAVAASVEALPPPVPVSRTTGNCASGTRTTVTGELDLPKWQAGSYPYLGGGGGLVIASGMAVQQGTERVDFEMTFPCGPAPAAGWPILLFMDGTGGSAESLTISELGNGLLPYIVASIAPLYSGDRTVPNSLPPELIFFNYLNPLAGRTNQLQQAGDMIYLRRIVEGAVLSAAETGNAAAVPTDDSLVVIAGHSQGALTIPHVLAVDGHFDGGFISAGGAGFYHSLIHRADVRSLVNSLLGANEIDMFHPVVHGLQTVAEVGDAANYSARVAAAHVVLVGGLKDGCSPLETIGHLGTALGLEVANPLYHPVFGVASLEPTVVALPAMGNLAGGRTGVTVQLDTGHFGASTNPNIGRSFVESFVGGGVPEVDPGPLAPNNTAGCSGRFDPLP